MVLVASILNSVLYQAIFSSVLWKDVDEALRGNARAVGAGRDSTVICDRMRRTGRLSRLNLHQLDSSELKRDV
jgi:hypothetical protein